MGKTFVSWLEPETNSSWIDVGCGTGALSQAILESARPASIVSVDLSDGFVATARQRLGDSARCLVGDATNLEFPDSEYNNVVSALTLNFIPDPDLALKEMKRVANEGATVGTYVWDYAGNMQFLKYFWDSVVNIDSAASEMHESKRFAYFDDDFIEDLYKSAGFRDIWLEKLEIKTVFESFDDYWQPFLGGQGPGPTYVQSLDQKNRTKLEDNLKASLPCNSNGAIELVATAWAAKSYA